MLTIGSPHIAEALRSPEMTAAGPSRDDSCSRQVQEGVRTVLTIAAPVVGVVPLAGPPLKAAIGGLLEIFNVADVSSIWPNSSNRQKITNKKLKRIIQNKEEIKELEQKLRWLDNHIFMVPVPPQGISNDRDDLTR